MCYLCCCLHWVVLLTRAVFHTCGVVHRVCEQRRDIGRVFMSAFGGGRTPSARCPALSHRGCRGYRRHSFLGAGCPKTILGQHCATAICYWVDTRDCLDDSYSFGCFKLTQYTLSFEDFTFKNVNVHIIGFAVSLTFR